MNSKYKLFSTLVQKTLVGSTNYASRSGVINLQSRTWYSQQKFSPQSLLKNLSLSNHCGCFVRSSNAPVLSSSVISRHYASTPPDPTPPVSEPAEKKLSLYQRFKMMYRDYWYVLLPVHLVTSAGWLGGFYYMASSGVDIVALLEHLNFSDKIINPLRNGHATTGYIAIAYALYKVATPLRYTVTLGGTTLSINYLKKWGYIKPRPVPSKEKLKEMYEGQKEILKGKGQTIKDNMMQSLKPSESKKNP